MRRLHAMITMPAIVGLAVYTACSVNPVTGKRQFNLISESQEIAMGQQAAQEAEQSIGLVDDRALNSYVHGVGTAMAAGSERPQLPWTFKVVDDPVPNAFALPGGYIFVTRGLLGLMRTESELATVLGHEIGHVTLQHGVTMMSRGQLANLGLGIGSMLSPEIAQYAQLAGTGLQLLFLRYGRDAERDADDNGFRYAYNVKYDVRDMVNVFAQLEAASQAAGYSPLPQWLASHPYPAERIERIQLKLAGMTASDFAGTNRNVDAFMNRINGLVYGENPRSGYFEGYTFLHPDLRFRIDFPQGWRMQNLRQSVNGISAEEDAAIQLTIVQESEQQAANQFFGQQGISSSQVTRTTINELPAVTGYFQAQTQSGVVSGVAAFITHDDNTYQIVAYSTAARFPAYDVDLRNAIRSFARLTDRRALDVKPKRIAIVRPTQAMTLAQFNQRYPSVIPIEELARINQLSGGTARIQAGTPIKRIVTGS